MGTLWSISPWSPDDRDIHRFGGSHVCPFLPIGECLRFKKNGDSVSNSLSSFLTLLRWRSLRGHRESEPASSRDPEIDFQGLTTEGKRAPSGGCTRRLALNIGLIHSSFTTLGAQRMSGGATISRAQSLRTAEKDSFAGRTRAMRSPRYIYPGELLNSPAALSGLASDKGADESEDQPSAAKHLSGVAEDASWWLVYTKSRQEKRLSDQLAEMEVAHYLPVHQRDAITRGRVRIVEEPLFAGYLFLLANDDQRRDALSTNRISTTQAIPKIDAIRLPYDLAQIARSISVGTRLTPEANYEPGQWVRVKSGPHLGLEGTVLQRKNKTNLVLSVDFLKQGASLEIADCYLERTSPPKYSGAGCVEIVGRRGL